MECRIPSVHRLYGGFQKLLASRMLVNDDNKIFLLFSAAGVELTNSFRENSFIKTSRINVFSAGYFFSTIIENFAARIC